MQRLHPRHSRRNGRHKHQGRNGPEEQEGGYGRQGRRTQARAPLPRHPGCHQQTGRLAPRAIQRQRQLGQPHPVQQRSKGGGRQTEGGIHRSQLQARRALPSGKRWHILRRFQHNGRRGRIRFPERRLALQQSQGYCLGCKAEPEQPDVPGQQQRRYLRRPLRQRQHMAERQPRKHLHRCRRVHQQGWQRARLAGWSILRLSGRPADLHRPQ